MDKDVASSSSLGKKNYLAILESAFLSYNYFMTLADLSVSRVG